MKRTLCLILAVLMLLAFSACASNGAESTAGSGSKSGGFQVGYGRVDISPYEESVPLEGYGNTSTRMSDGVADRLYITCVAFTDAGGETVLMYTVDLTSIGPVADDLWESVSEDTGIPIDHIMISATHTHSAPDVGNTNEQSIIRYRTRLAEWAIDAANAALADRAPATAETASTNNLNLCMEEAAKYGMSSQWHAAGIITRNNRLGDTISMELEAFSIGDVAFLAAPYEMFDQNGVQIKEGSPFSMTFIATICNGANGYIASEMCASHGCYGYDSRSWGSIGDAEVLVTDYLGMLDSLYASK